MRASFAEQCLSSVNGRINILANNRRIFPPFAFPFIGGYFDFILGGVPGGGPIFFAAVREGDAGKIRVRLYGGAHGLSDVSVLDGNWHHIVWGIDESSSIFFYVDGILQTSLPTIGSVTGETELVFGGRLDQALPFVDFFNGKIDDIRIFDRGLSPAEIQDLYNE